MAEWKSTGHLFLALEKCGVSALWLLAQIRRKEFLILITEALNENRKYMRDAADDLEVALFFDIWPDYCPALLQAIQAVGHTWKSTRVLTLRGLLKRRDGLDGEAIQTRMEQCRTDRKEAATDAADALWLTSPSLAASLVRRSPSTTVNPLEAFLLRSQESARKELESGLMDGLEDA